MIECEAKSIEAAAWVAEKITNSGSMLPKSAGEVEEMLSQNRAVILYDDDCQPVAHAAITFLYEEAKVLEIGGIIVREDMRRQGWGVAVTLATLALAREQYPGWKMMALCNEQSLPLLLKLGAEVVTRESLDMVPPEAWEACVTCPNYQKAKAAGKICCDTPVLLDMIQI